MLSFSFHIQCTSAWCGTWVQRKTKCCPLGVGSLVGSGHRQAINNDYTLVAQLIKNSPAMWEIWLRSLGWEDPLEKEMATHSSMLAWRIPWTEEPGGLQSTGSQRVRHGWATNTFSFTSLKTTQGVRLELCTPPWNPCTRAPPQHSDVTVLGDEPLPRWLR